MTDTPGVKTITYDGNVNHYKVGFLPQTEIGTNPAPLSGQSAAYQFRVPVGVTSIIVECWGGEGAGSNPIDPSNSLDLDTHSAGGLGGYVKASVPVTPGEILEVMAGQSGFIGTYASWSGQLIWSPYGYPGATSDPGYVPGSGWLGHQCILNGLVCTVPGQGWGGGASWVRRTTGARAFLVVAGGGGGGGEPGEFTGGDIPSGGDGGGGGGSGDGLAGQDGRRDSSVPNWAGAGSGYGGTTQGGGGGFEGRSYSWVNRAPIPVTNTLGTNYLPESGVSLTYLVDTSGQSWRRTHPGGWVASGFDRGGGGYGGQGWYGGGAGGYGPNGTGGGGGGGGSGHCDASATVIASYPGSHGGEGRVSISYVPASGYGGVCSSGGARARVAATVSVGPSTSYYRISDARKLKRAEAYVTAYADTGGVAYCALYLATATDGTASALAGYGSTFQANLKFPYVPIFVNGDITMMSSPSSAAYAWSKIGLRYAGGSMGVGLVQGDGSVNVPTTSPVTVSETIYAEPLFLAAGQDNGPGLNSGSKLLVSRLITEPHLIDPLATLYAILQTFTYTAPGMNTSTVTIHGVKGVLCGAGGWQIGKIAG